MATNDSGGNAPDATTGTDHTDHTTDGDADGGGRVLPEGVPSVERDLLALDGVVETLLFLEQSGDTHTRDDVVGAVDDLTENTVGGRTRELVAAGLVEEDAEIIDGTARKVYTVSEDGALLARVLADLFVGNESPHDTE